MTGRILFIFFCYTLFCSEINAQRSSILPFTAARFYEEGIIASRVEIKVDGAYLLTNRVPINKEIEFHLKSPQGFTGDKEKLIFVGLDLSIESGAGQEIAHIPNVYKENEAKGFQIGVSKELIAKVAVKPEYVNGNTGCIFKLKFYDLKGKNQCRIEFHIVVTRPGEDVQVSKAWNSIKAPAETQAVSNIFRANSVVVSLDTNIRVAPKMAYASFDIQNIKGTSISELLSGKESFFVYDENLKEIKVTEKQLKQISGTMENNEVNYLAKVPYRLKNLSGKIFYVRFRWESVDRQKIIEVISRFE